MFIGALLQTNNLKQDVNTMVTELRVNLSCYGFEMNKTYFSKGKFNNFIKINFTTMANLKHKGNKQVIIL